MDKKYLKMKNSELLQLQKNTENSLFMVNRLLQKEIKQKRENFILSKMFNFLKVNPSSETATSSKAFKPSW